MIDELPPLPAPALKIQRAYGEEEGFYSDVHMSHYALVVYHMRDAEVADLRAERDALLKDAERMAWLAENLEWDGHGRWLPELHVELRGHASHRECLNATIDEAMASSSEEGK